MDSAAAVRYAVGRRLRLVLPRRLVQDAGVSDGVARSGRILVERAIGRGCVFFDGQPTSYANTLSRVHCYLCLLGGGGLYAGLYVVAVLMTSVHTVLNAATANISWPSVVCLGGARGLSRQALALRCICLAMSDVRWETPLGAAPPCKP